MKFPLYHFVVLLCATIFPVFVAGQEITFNFIEGDFVLCEGDSTITILIVPTPGEPWSEIELYWTATSAPIIITDASMLEQSNTYDLSPLLENCNYPNNCPGVNGYCVTITLVANYENITTQNVSKNIEYRKTPVPEIQFSAGPYCVGEELQISVSTCPDNDPDVIYEWTLPDGSIVAELSNYIPLTTGPHTFSLSATNGCGTGTASASITVVDLPDVMAIIDTGAVEISADNYRVCLDGTANVLFTTAGTINTINYDWSGSGTGFQILGSSTNDSLSVSFTSAGTFTFTLIGSNGCQATDEAVITVEVVESPVFSLNNQADACPSLEYTPDPFDPLAIYRINGVIQSTFPVTLGPSATPYQIEASRMTECRDYLETDEFIVSAAIVPVITNPANNTQFCPDTAMVLLAVNDPDGSWQPAAGLVFVGDDAFFDLSSPADDYSFTYTLGSGACERSVTINLSIAAAVISLPSDFEICSTADPVDLTISPIGGTLDGMGIADASIFTFDPDGLAPGDYTLTYTFLNTNTNCTEVGRFVATVIAEPTLEVGEPISLCNSNTELLLEDVTSFVFTPNNADLTYAGAGVTDASNGSYIPGGLPVGTMDSVVVTYTIIPGCLVMDTLLVNITEVVTPMVGGDTTICGGTGTFNLGPTQGGDWSGNQAAANGDVNLSNLPPGSYDYTLTLDGGGLCQSSNSRMLTVIAGDGVTIDNDAIYLCDTAMVLSLPATTPANGGNWSGDLPISGNDIDVSGVVAGTYNFNFVVSSLPEGCNTADLTVNILERPEVGVTGDSLGCAGSDCLDFTATGDPADRYRWEMGDGQTLTGNAVCHTYDFAGQYTAELTAYRLHPINGNDLCAAPLVTTAVRILAPPPIIGIVANGDTVCPGQAVTFSRGNIVNNEYLSYVWNFGIRLDSLADPDPISFPSPVEDTVYQIYLETINPCGSKLDSFELLVRADPSARIGIVYDQPCSGASLIGTNLATGTLDDVSWTTSDGQIFNSFQPPVLTPFTDSLPRQFFLQLVVGNVCGVDTAVAEVTINPTDVRALPGFTDTVICFNDPFIVTNNSTPNAPYQLVFSDGNTYTADTVAHLFSAPGIYDFTVYATGCGYDSSNWRVRVKSLPILAVDAASPICPYETFDYSLSGDGMNYLIYFGDGDSSFLANGSHVYPFQDTSLILMARTENDGCSKDSSFTVTILPQPVALATVSDSVCAGQAVNFTSNSLNASNCRWMYGDGEVDDGCFVEHIYEESGLFSATLIATSNLGCPDTTSFPVFVAFTPTADFTFDFVDSCGPVLVDFNTLTPADLASSYTYELGDGNTSNSRDFSHLYRIGGEIMVELTVGWNGLCFDRQIKTLDLRANPNVTTEFTDDRCFPTDYARLDVFTADPGDNIFLFGPDFTQEGIDRFEFNTPGLYELEVVNEDLCDTVITFSLEAINPIIIRTIEDTLIRLGDSLRLTTIHNQQDLIWYWTAGQFLSDSTIANPIAKPTRSLTTFFVTAQDSNGCFAQDTVNVTVEFKDPVYVPNAFSPNNDGVNDFFTIFPKPGVTRIESFGIYTRWGNQVYELKGEEYDAAGIGNWDGTHNGKPLDPQVLVYVLKYLTERGDTEVQKGGITLLRSRD